MPSCREGPAGAGTGTQWRRGRATQRKVRAVLPALPRSESAPRSCPRCSSRPARSPLLRAHPRSSLPGPPPGSAFVVLLGCRARGSRVRAVAPRDLGQPEGSGTPLGPAQVLRLKASVYPHPLCRVPRCRGAHRQVALSPRGGSDEQATHLDAEDNWPQKQRRPSAAT